MEKSERIFVAGHRGLVGSAVVGGIAANDAQPAEFIHGNLCIQTNVIHAARLNGVKRLLFLGSSCIYPKLCNFDLEKAHVLPALLRKFHEAKTKGLNTVAVWGTGKPRREFLHVDDLARACVLLLGLDGYKELTNIGSGADVSIRELAGLVAETVGFKGSLAFDASKPDGTPRKLLDIGRIKAPTPAISSSRSIPAISAPPRSPTRRATPRKPEES